MAKTEEPPIIVAIVEVGKCKRLFQDPDAPMTSSASVTIALENTVLSTQIVPETADPFFNEAFEFKVPTTLDESTGEVGHRELQWSYQVVDSQFEPARVIGQGTLVLPCNVAGKGEVTQDLTGPDGENERGTILFRFKITPPKPKVFDPNVDLKVSMIPKFDAQVELAPLQGGGNKRLWMMFLETSPTHFRDVFERRLVESFKEEKAERKHPTKTPTDVVTLRWKCKRTHQFLTRLRLCASRFLLGEPLAPITQDDESSLKIKLKEHAFCKDSQAMYRSNKVTQLIDRLFLYFADGVDYRTPMTHISFDHRTKMQSQVFKRTEFEALTASVLQLFMPSLSATTLESFAKEEWETDPKTSKSAKDEHDEHIAGLKKKELDEMDDITRLAAKQLDEILEKPPATAGIPTISNEDFLLFDHILRKYASWWCETFTDAEYCAFLRALAPAIPMAKLKLGTAPETTGKTPRSGRSGRRRSSARSPRTPR